MPDIHVQSLNQRLHETNNNESLASDNLISNHSISKKRKSFSDTGDNEVRKRSKAAASSPSLISTKQSTLILSPEPSRSITPIQKSAPPMPVVDEDEWAAFEADIAASERQEPFVDAVISAPALTAEEVNRKSREEEYNLKKEKEEERLTGEKEDAARKMEEELEKMEILEAKVKKLKAKREELRKKKPNVEELNKQSVSDNISVLTGKNESVNEDEDEDEDEGEDDQYDEEWDSFRVKR